MLLVIAHPGHELRIHGWLERERPTVLVLTDGSGRTGLSRLDATVALCTRVGARRGPVFGAYPDSALYAALLAGDMTPFLSLRDSVRDTLRKESPECVVSDGVEGYNPIHDLCHAVVRSARARVTPRPLHFDFPLIGSPATCAPNDRDRARWLNLDAAAFARKLAAIDAYPQLEEEARASFGGQEVSSAAFDHMPDLRAEVAALRGGTRREDFGVECLRPASSGSVGTSFYDRYGRALVKAGRYTRAIQHAEHVLPVIAALDEH